MGRTALQSLSAYKRVHFYFVRITHGRCLLALTFVITLHSTVNAVHSIHLRQETFLFLKHVD